MALTPSQANVVATVLALPRVVEVASLRAFSYDGESYQDVAIAAVEASSDVPIHVVFTLGNLPNAPVLVTVTDGDPEAVADVLCQFEQHCAVGRLVASGTTLISSHPYLQGHGRVGAILADPVSNAVDGLPHEIAFRGQTRAVRLVIFLDQDEHALRRSRGLDALGDHWDAVNKDYVAISAKPPARET